MAALRNGGPEPILVAVSEEYFTASVSKVNYTGTSAERRPMTPVAQYFIM